MKYAVPVVDGKMSQHFGHCQIFSLFEVDEQSKTITGREDLPSPEHQPGVLPRLAGGPGRFCYPIRRNGPSRAAAFPVPWSQGGNRRC